ncbi:MAG: hypothetical protein Q8Q86_03920, partial [Candidatus Daviesbacteria bacterium]|nr:hypothetical protein [Candidatus Daviesbacteria bacterium]
FFIYYLNKRDSRRGVIKIFTFLVALVPFLLILLIAKGIYPGSFLGLFRPYKITSYQQVILPYISSFDPSFLFIKGDTTPYHSTGKHGMFLLASLPFFLLGVVRIIQKRQPILTFVTASFFLTPILFGLGSDVHRGSRLLSLIPSFVVISSIGMMFLLGIRHKLWRLILVVIIILVIFLNFADFLRNYWYEYPGMVKSEFSKPYHLVFERAASLSKLNNLIPFIQDDFRRQDEIAENFFEQAYFPNGLKTWNDNQVLPEKSIIIVSDYFLSKRQDIPQEKIGDGDFGILINNESK